MYLLLAVVLSQSAVYEWVDGKGGTHYTNDASSIPAGAKVRTVEGTELTVVPAAKPDVAPRVAPATVNRCEEGKKQVAALEKQLADLVKQRQQRRDEEASRCQQALNAQGQGAYARCVAGVGGRAPEEEGDAAEANLRRQLEEAKESLRRTQVSGCR
mgnify:CR=1 FL=1